MRNYSNNYSTTTAGHNGRMRAAELARDSVFALVPCKEMARGSGALGSCTGVARDSLVALGSAAVRTDGLATEQAVLWFFARKRREKAVLSEKGERKRCSAALETQVRRRVFGKNGRAGIIGSILCVAIIAPVYSIPIPMVLCCIYISHIVLPVLFVLFSILTLCDPV